MPGDLPEPDANPFASPSPAPHTAAVSPPPDALPRSSWPTVIGIVAIGLGIMGFIGGVWGAISLLIFANFRSDMAGQGNPFVFQYDATYQVLLFAFVAVTLLLAAWLIFVGVGILRRRGWAATTALTWAAAKMLYVAVQIGFTYHMQGLQMQEMMRQQNGAMPFEMDTVFSTIRIISAIGGLAWGWALPVFLLFWFMRERIKAEVATWRTAS